MNKLSPFKWFVLQNFPFIEADFDALTNYELMCKIVEYLNATIAKTNELGNQVETLTNWFNNLDVQEEINNKLDEMADSGELEEIMADYLNTKAIFSFDSISDLKQATNLIDGSYAETYGYYDINDGGSAKYKIRQVTNQDVEDDIFIIALADENLVAELICNKSIKVEQAGINSNTTASVNSSKLLKLIEKFATDGGEILFTNTYDFEPMEIDYTVDNVRFLGLSKGSTIINKPDTYTDYLFTFKKKTRWLQFKDIQIECNQRGGAFYFKQWDTTKWKANHVNITFKDVMINHCEQGIHIEGGVYIKSEDLGISLGLYTTSADNFAFKLEGFEYNFFTRCSFQVWIEDVTTTSPDMGLLVLDGASTLYVQDSEFVSTYGAGIKATTTLYGLQDIWLEKNTFYFVNKPIDIETTTNPVGFMRILNNTFYAGHGSQANIYLHGERHFLNCIVENNRSTYSKTIEVQNDRTYRYAPLIIKDNYNQNHTDNSAYSLHDNYFKLQGGDFLDSYEENKTTTATTNSHDLYINYNILPKDLVNPVVIVQANTPDGIPVTAKCSQSADPDNGTHHVSIMHPNLPAGTYKFTLKFIYT